MEPPPTVEDLVRYFEQVVERPVGRDARKIAVAIFRALLELPDDRPLERDPEESP
jgi:hypothetical protein